MITTSINREYLLRMAGVSLIIAAMGAWFVYDGAVKYPRQNVEYKSFVEALEARPEVRTAQALMEEDDAGVTAVERISREAGLELPSKKLELVKGTKEAVDKILETDGDPKAKEAQVRKHEGELQKKLRELPYGESDIRSQFICAGLAFAFALYLGGVLLRRMRTRYTADDGGIGAGSRRHAYADISRVDWSRWATKDIAKIIFKDNSVLTLDAWHYNGVKEIVGIILGKRSDLNPPDGKGCCCQDEGEAT